MPVETDIPGAKSRTPGEARGAARGAYWTGSEAAQAPKKGAEEAPAPGSVQYQRLCQRHSDYDAELLDLVDLLYRGGFRIQREAKRLLVKLEGESQEKFVERCRLTSYAAFFGQIVDQFVSDVFGQPLSVKPAADADNPNTPGENPDEEFYSEFEKDADRRGTSFVDVMTETLRTALKHGRALVVVDAPRDDSGAAAPENRADEESRGLRRLYAYATPVARLVDWKCDDETGEFLWCVLYDREEVHDAPFVARDSVRETWTLWTLNDSGKAEWTKYELTYKKSEPPDPERYVRRVDGGRTVFSRIPVLRFELPEGLWVGDKIGPQAIEYWQRRSALLGAENRSLVAIPYVKRGPQANEAGGAIPSELAERPAGVDRPFATFNSKGWLELDAGDEAGFAEPEGKCYSLVDGQLEKLREVMFQVTFQMAASVQRNATAMGRSGTSKKKDEDLTGRVLRALGHFIRESSVEVFDTVSAARGEDAHWTPHGLDGYDSEDREVVIEEAIALPQIVEAIPSETFHKVEARAVAERLLKGQVDVETMAVIIDEIETGVEEQRAQKKLIEDAVADEKLAGSKARAEAFAGGDPTGGKVDDGGPKGPPKPTANPGSSKPKDKKDDKE